MKKKPILLLVMLLISTLLLLGCDGGPLSKKVETTEIGTWVETKKVSERDGKLYPMKYRITDVDRDKASVEKRVQEYNVSARGSTVADLTNDNLEYAIADYEAYYPKDFPDDEYGITAVSIPFTIAGTDGEPEISVDGTNYKGLTDTWEIGAPPMGYDFFSDSTYKGSILFVMVKGNGEYVFSEGYEEGDETITHYIEGK